MADPLSISERHETASRYRQIVEEALVGLYVSTPGGRFVFGNAAIAAMLGFASVDEMIGATATSMYASPEEREAFVERVRSAGRLEPHRRRLRRRDGSSIEVLEAVVGEFDERGALVELRGQVVDVTATAAVEEALRERERQFRAVFNDAADAILILDDRRAIVEANTVARTLFGFESPQTTRLDDLLAEDRQILAAVWTELLALGEAKHEHRVRAGPQRGRIVECSYRARVQDGRHLCIARDISSRRMLEERLQESQRIETVGRLAGGIAHEFNNLLTAMLGYTELLIAARSPDDKERGDLEEIQKAGLRAAGLTQQLLAFSRKQILLPKDVDLNEALESVRGLLARLIREDLRLVVTPGESPAIVRIDPGQLEQVVVNLVLNARDAISNDGEIFVSIERRSITAADAAIDPRVPAGEYAVLHVADSGIGMPPEVRAHLFEPFFTTKVGKGSGLGLASVHGIVRQSNGYITVESEPGAGTRVAVFLPLVGLVRAAARPSESETPGPRGTTILLVEDEDAVRVIVSAVLRRSGYNVLEASTPRGACEIFAQHAAAIGLLLTDVVMPEMNGPALAQRLVAERPELRVLFISGYADVSGPFATDSPNVSFLGKPFQASVLVERVRELLARPRTGPGAQ